MYEALFFCEERRGARVRRVYEVPTTFELQDYLRARIDPAWSPVKDLDLLWSKGVRTFLVDNVGAFFVGPYRRDGMPDGHMVFWDRVLRGREQMARAMARYAASDCGSPGIWTAIPNEAKVVLAFAKRVGFKVEAVGENLTLMTLIT